MIHATKGIVLRIVKYGETSVIASVYTELFGIQSYMVNGVRTPNKSAKFHYFQPACLLEMEVYHNDLKNLQRLKEIKWNYLYKNVFNNVIKNGIALYMVELLQKCLKQSEENTNLFHFCEDAFIHLDNASEQIMANFPIFFAMQLTQFFGLSIQDNYSIEKKYFSINEGNFISASSQSEYVADENISYYISQLLKAQHPDELTEVKMNRYVRRGILTVLEKYYMFHIPEFSAMKTLPVLYELLG